MKIVEREQMLLAGFGFYGDPFNGKAGWTEENEIGILWSRFMGLLFKPDSPIAHLKENKEWFEVWIETEESAEKGFFEIFVGTQVSGYEDVPYTMQMKVLPKASYAVVTAHGSSIKSEEPYIEFQKWLKSSGTEQKYKYNFQTYDERFRGIDKIAESELDFYFPIK
ncbi:MAG: GyrI-like domain-containing protein [Candidatus Cloacimonetes bacterium]|nr:GyrI-like domain-containing protein [Candidatus Cloacimonadota bacterium]